METPLYISGLDTTEFSNLVKQWFKWDKLFEVAKNSETVKELNLSDDAVSSVIYAIEDEIRQTLYTYAEDLDESKEKLDVFLKGASWALDHKDDSEEF